MDTAYSRRGNDSASHRDCGAVNLLGATFTPSFTRADYSTTSRNISTSQTSVCGTMKAPPAEGQSRRADIPLNEITFGLATN